MSFINQNCNVFSFVSEQDPLILSRFSGDYNVPSIKDNIRLKIADRISRISYIRRR